MNLQAGRLIFSNAFDLRKALTPAEQKLWNRLRGRQVEGVKFRRQHSIRKFVLDFYAHEVKLGIELDGRHHVSDSAQQFYDTDRSAILAEYGIHILRFTNALVKDDIDHVIELIAIEIRSRKK